LRKKIVLAERRVSGWRIFLVIAASWKRRDLRGSGPDPGGL